MISLHVARQHLGRGVVHAPSHGPREDGTIERVTIDWVMVRYAQGGVKATNPRDLEFLRALPDDEKK